MYEVLDTLDHDGQTYYPGSQVKLTKSQAEPLLDLGVIAPVKAEAKPKE